MRLTTPNRLVLLAMAAVALPTGVRAQPKPPANPTAQATLLGRSQQTYESLYLSPALGGGRAGRAQRA